MIMPSPLINFNYTYDGLNVTACMENAQEKINLYNAFFTFGAVFPILVWPLLPSTSEILNYRMLAFSSSAELVLLGLWTVYFWADHNTLSRDQGFQFWVVPLLCCCLLLGVEGYKAGKLGRSRRREDFKNAASVTFGLLPYVMAMAAEIVGSHVGELMNLGGGFELALIGGALVVCLIIRKPCTELAMTFHHRFTTRQIPALYWLPQNGAMREFEPWWSRQLRLIVLGYIFFLMYILLAAIDVSSKCRL